MYAMLVNKSSFLIWVGRRVMQGFESACLSVQSFHVLPVALVIPPTIKRHAYFSKCELLVCLISCQKVATCQLFSPLPTKEDQLYVNEKICTLAAKWHNTNMKVSLMILWDHQGIFTQRTATHWIFSLFLTILCESKKLFCIKITVN